MKIGHMTAFQTNEFMYKNYNNLLLPAISNNYFAITSEVDPCRPNLRSSNNYRPSHINIHMVSIKCAGPNAWNQILFV